MWLIFEYAKTQISMLGKTLGLLAEVIPFLILLYYSLGVSGILKSETTPERLRNPSIYVKLILYALTIALGLLILNRVA